MLSGRGTRVRCARGGPVLRRHPAAALAAPRPAGGRHAAGAACPPREESAPCRRAVRTLSQFHPGRARRRAPLRARAGPAARGLFPVGSEAPPKGFFRTRGSPTKRGERTPTTHQPERRCAECRCSHRGRGDRVELRLLLPSQHRARGRQLWIFNKKNSLEKVASLFRRATQEHEEAAPVVEAYSCRARTARLEYGRCPAVGC